MNTTQIACTLKDVRSFLGVFPSDMLPRSVTQTGTVIINTDPHTEKCSHWLAVHFFPKSSSAYYFDSYGILPLVTDTKAFIRRNCTVWDYNKRQLQGLTSNTCGKYCCLFALYMTIRRATRKCGVSRDRSSEPSLPNLGRGGSSPPPRRGNVGCGVQCSSSLLYKRWVLFP